MFLVVAGSSTDPSCLSELMLQHVTGLLANAAGALLDTEILLLTKSHAFRSCKSTTHFIMKQKKQHPRPPRG